MEIRPYDDRPDTGDVGAPGAVPPSGAVRPSVRLRGLRLSRRALVGLVAGGLLAGGALVLLPGVSGHEAVAPAPGPRARALALTAVTSGRPAALPDLAVLIGRQESLVRARPRDARAWAVLGSAYVARGRREADAADFPRAERALRTSLKVKAEGNAEALGALASLANARRDFPAAKRYGEQARKLTPKEWSAYPPLIDAYTGLGDYKRAGSTLEKLLELHTGPAARPAVMARASQVYRDRGWREDAEAQLADAAAAAGTPAERAAYLADAGRLAWERGDREDALRHYRAAVRLDPDRREALAGQGRALAALGRNGEALDAYAAAVATRPRPEDLLDLGELYESLGRGGQAGEQYALLRKRLRQAESGGVDEDLLTGRFEADHGDATDAVARLRAEWARQPGIAVADALGWALHRTGADEEALTYAAVATDAAKGGGVRSAPYAFHRGMIEQGLGLAAPARRHLEEALRINPWFSPLDAPEAQRALAALGPVPDEPLPSEE
ncbi:tetratricopeptide repeat protein [Streptomyces sp. NPDC047028]|uniref:tetratricopeptide repeat protein n=1 Tax=Streptomyces sp. NPDC047028 TaxID=3155793 RepID=UPI0033FFCF53